VSVKWLIGDKIPASLLSALDISQMLARGDIR
jgi:hypothetical protein